jgi:hypothetical protein
MMICARLAIGAAAMETAKPIAAARPSFWPSVANPVCVCPDALLMLISLTAQRGGKIDVDLRRAGEASSA